jgi:uncharacterized protein YfkK (UPF0435 family)
MDYVKNNLVVDTFTVKSIRDKKIMVNTFKVQKMSDYLKENLDAIYQFIEEEKRNHEKELT